MKHKISKLLLICAVTTALALVLAGCGVQVTALNLALPESVNVGESANAELTAEYDKADAKDEEKNAALAELGVVWASSDETVATVDESGVVTGMAAGSATITAAAGEGAPALKAEKTITILVPLEGVSAPETLALALNKTESAKLEVKPVPENATVKGDVTYASSDESVVTVSADGTVTAKANGEAVITVTLDEKTAETKITVTTAATGIALEKTEGVLYVGGSYTIKAYTEPEEALESSYTYASENEKIATVNEAGVITAKRAGTAKITVTSGDGFTAVYTITVKNKPAAGGNVSGSGAAANGNGGAGSTGGATASPSGDTGDGQTSPSTPVCDKNGPGHALVGQCPVCGLNNGGWDYIGSDGQQGDGLEGDAW